MKAKRAFVPSAICPIIGYGTVLQEVNSAFFAAMMAARLFAREIDTAAFNPFSSIIINIINTANIS
ncbi:hypothetical protein [Bacillus atrophaeus]|uniref:hypothetical protein n=1 Tax=Bacillus atrophaeus TaxID=1452 RepID=UPI00227E8EE4|nr:hypothetical protein [Bacillus atrophaeus]MCY8465984.1 hypothetical protein [Bacillus atrophaeus]MCY8476470.1 hypothetical protein [Bacillus atrophaeus]